MVTSGSKGLIGPTITVNCPVCEGEIELETIARPMDDVIVPGAEIPEKCEGCGHRFTRAETSTLGKEYIAGIADWNADDDEEEPADFMLDDAEEDNG